MTSTLIDISELWAASRFLSVPAAGWALFYYAKHIQRRWIRISARAVASLTLVLSFVIAVILLLVQLSCAKNSQSYSPDGKYVVVISYIGQGALGADYASIFIRRRWSLDATRIFYGEAQWDFKLDRLGSPELKWPDNTHLLINGYHGQARCESRVDGIQITCVQSTAVFTGCSRLCEIIEVARTGRPPAFLWTTPYSFVARESTTLRTCRSRFHTICLLL